jgi:hypothetical protein
VNYRLILLPQFDGSFRVGHTVQADAKFLRRVLLGLILLTLVTGGMAGFTTVQAMTEKPSACLIFCE